MQSIGLQPVILPKAIGNTNAAYNLSLAMGVLVSAKQGEIFPSMLVIKVSAPSKLTPSQCKGKRYNSENL